MYDWCDVPASTPSLLQSSCSQPNNSSGYQMISIVLRPPESSGPILHHTAELSHALVFPSLPSPREPHQTTINPVKVNPLTGNMYTEKNTTEDTSQRGHPSVNRLEGRERVYRLKIRRARANARERCRMHGLNSALDELRQRIPQAIFSRKLPVSRQSHNIIDQYNQVSPGNFGQNLSKIETLRLARNYIGLLSAILRCNRLLTCKEMIAWLSRGLSQITTNQICSAIGNNEPHALLYDHLTMNSSIKSNWNEHKPSTGQIKRDVELVEFLSNDKNSHEEFRQHSKRARIANDGIYDCKVRRDKQTNEGTTGIKAHDSSASQSRGSLINHPLETTGLQGLGEGFGSKHSTVLGNATPNYPMLTYPFDEVDNLDVREATDFDSMVEHHFFPPLNTYASSSVFSTNQSTNDPYWIRWGEHDRNRTYCQTCTDDSKVIYTNAAPSCF